MAPSVPFSPEDYRPYACGSGADKLADSQVAPLVAVARGTRTIRPDGIKPLLDGRVAVIEDRRSVTTTEQATGLYAPRLEARDIDSRVEIEMTWRDPDGAPQTGIISGPGDLLGSQPNEWRRIPGTAIPTAVQRLTEWPPVDRGFMMALKANRPLDTLIRPLWDHMGWVPVQDSTPVFLVGNQVIGPHGFADDAAASAVSTREVRSADRFGVQLPDDTDDARHALRTVMDAYYPDDPDRAPFRNPQHAAIFLATALRPTVPLDCHVSVALTGSSGSGKSWASASALLFWQAEPGSWTDRALPGTATDTVAYSEVAISKTPIWVVDDLAPSDDDPAKHGRQAEAVWSLVRAVHNKSSRGRRKSDMSAQEVFTPRALLIVSAEQTPERNQSIMNRLVHVKVRSRQFLSESRDPTNRIVALGADECPQSKVTGYILRMLPPDAPPTADGSPCSPTWEPASSDTPIRPATHWARKANGRPTRPPTSRSA